MYPLNSQLCIYLFLFLSITNIALSSYFKQYYRKSGDENIKKLRFLRKVKYKRV